MSARVIDLTRRETAATELERLNEFLTLIETARIARADWEQRDPAGSRDLTDTEQNVLAQLEELGEGVLRAALDPALVAFLECIRDVIADIAEARP